MCRKMSMRRRKVSMRRIKVYPPWYGRAYPPWYGRAYPPWCTGDRYPPWCTGELPTRVQGVLHPPGYREYYTHPGILRLYHPGYTLLLMYTARWSA